MIKPYNTNILPTKKTSMFNTLGVDYNSHSLEHQIQIYQTELILQMEIPLFTETGQIRNEGYFDNRVKYILNKGVKNA
jgi:hypothetical protein